ncbi:hypothetical protein C5167_021369 [Papaver somniferum]|uniref:Uncharacterized protein n=1 Tax=Papaver somniferum TaxID=3469 RepID=A0A4Y7IYR8_PAPSO|nr:hypothetical protein C5167_021369 [Papaver somniferum]
MSIAQMMKSEFADKDYSLPGIRGVGTGLDAAEFILIGANIVLDGVSLNGEGTMVPKLNVQFTGL